MERKVCASSDRNQSLAGGYAGISLEKVEHPTKSYAWGGCQQGGVGGCIVCGCGCAFPARWQGSIRGANACLFIEAEVNF